MDRDLHNSQLPDPAILIFKKRKNKLIDHLKKTENFSSKKTKYPLTTDKNFHRIELVS
ncbi:hypothetical protein Bbad01_25560 [Bacillus badius]|nr:hypothetical protein Bbad01_25560 [Bacillus badius]